MSNNVSGVDPSSILGQYLGQTVERQQASSSVENGQGIFPPQPTIGGLGSFVRQRVRAKINSVHFLFLSPTEHFWWNGNVASMRELFSFFLPLPTCCLAMETNRKCLFQCNGWTIVSPGFVGYKTRRPNIGARPPPGLMPGPIIMSTNTLAATLTKLLDAGPGYYLDG